MNKQKNQIARLDDIADQLGIKLTCHKCKAMKSLIEEGEELASQEREPAVLDAGIIGAAQRVEHYEIAAYGTAATLAQTLGLEEIGNCSAKRLKKRSRRTRNRRN